MAEVYTISGPLGASTDTLSKLAYLSPVTLPYAAMQQARGSGRPAQAAVIPQPMAAPHAPLGSPVTRLQNALRSLGSLHGDPALSKLKVDGVVGPGTTKAVNYAIAQRYVVMPSFPRPELTVQHVRQFAAGIAAAVESAVTSGGGTLSTIRASSPARARGVAPALPPEALAPAPESDHKWVWWAVGGLGVLVILSIAAKAVRGKKSSKRRARDDDED